jgi:hypothetical protein
MLDGIPSAVPSGAKIPLAGRMSASAAVRGPALQRPAVPGRAVDNSELYIGVELRCELAAQWRAERTRPILKALAAATPGLSPAAASG